MSLLNEIEQYWTGRADGYSEVNQGELADTHTENWLRELESHIDTTKKDSLQILDIGTGPGFFSIILAKAGYHVTAVDYTQAMLDEAKVNAAREGVADRITFVRMDAQNLDFEDGAFDVIVTRNLTWNLPNPEKAYSEWMRVLKEGGKLLNYDANWYQYLYDEEARSGYETDRANTKDLGYKDQNVGENFDRMEEIAKQIPLSKIMRPAWDNRVLTNLGAKVEINHQVWQNVWSKQEQVSFASTPMFGVVAMRVAG